MEREGCCTNGGPGYATPLDAMKYGPKEKLLYVVCVQPTKGAVGGDYLATVDVDPKSATYSTVIHRTFTNKDGDELHHSGWNICSSCHTGPHKHGVRNKLVLPCLNSDNIYIMDTGTNPRAPTIHKVIDGQKIRDLNCSTPHTSHCLANGQIMISVMGDQYGNAKGDFILLDGNTFEIQGTWIDGEKAGFGYDFWYQPYWDTMISTEWGAPKVFKRGYDPNSPPGAYGTSLNFFSWSEKKLKQVIDLGVEGTTPLETRFLHNPKASQGFVGAALYGKIFRFFRKDDNTWAAEKVIDVPAKKVDGWLLPECNSLISDIILSLDDKFIYFSNWFHGDVRQYDISDPKHPKMTGQVFLGGVLTKGSGVTVTYDPELTEQPDPVFIKGRRLYGGPQMLQLSLDGKRLYVTSSLFSPWDREFYPDMIKHGSTIAKINILECGGMKLDTDFLVAFENEPNGPVLAHEMRYPGGDCSSDIWLVDQ